MKNENENENETNRKNWTDEKIINYIIDLSFEAENIVIELNNIEIDIEAVEATICTSPHYLIGEETKGEHKKLIPKDRLIDLVLHSITLKEQASILKVRIEHVEKNIKFFREIIDK